MAREYTSTKPEQFAEPVTFTLDSVVYTCRELGPLELSEIAKLQGLPVTDPRSLAFMANMFETLLGADQYFDFRQNCAKFETSIQVLAEVIQGVFADMFDRPISGSSASLDGPSNTGQNLMGDSFSRVMLRLDGRPDLQMAVMQARAETQ